MADNKTWLILAVLAYFVFAGGGSSTTTDTGGTTTTQPAVCPYAPTFELQAIDKWDSSQSLSASHLYKLNGGTVQTYSTETDANLGDSLKVLWGDGNGANGGTDTYFTQVKEYTIDHCGKHVITNKEMVRNTTYTMRCINDENTVLKGNTETAYTVGEAEAIDIECYFLGVAERGMPHGGVLFVALNTSNTWDATKIDVTGDIIEGKAADEANYTTNLTKWSAYGFDVAPFEGSGRRDFIVHLEAKSGVNPASTTENASGDDVVLHMYAKDCIKNTETDDFMCGLSDENDEFIAMDANTARNYLAIAVD